MRHFPATRPLPAMRSTSPCHDLLRRDASRHAPLAAYRLPCDAFQPRDARLSPDKEENEMVTVPAAIFPDAKRPFPIHNPGHPLIL